MGSGKVLELHGIEYGKILKNISFFWQQGENLALMGLNGSGKSTLARLLAGLLRPAAGEIKLYRDGVCCSGLDDGARWREIGYVGQHPRRQTLGATVAEELGFGLINLGMEYRAVVRRISELAEQIGLQGRENQSPAELSGGERQRLVTAAILALKPSFLILDESLSMLDALSEERILNILHQAKPETGQLWITHEPELARKADRLLVLDQGCIRDWGRPKQAFKDPELAYLVGTAASACGIKRSENMPSYDGVGARQGIPVSKSSECSETVLAWQDTEFDGRLKLNNSVRAGEFLVIVGHSGSGKTTLLESVAGLLFPTKGQVRICGEVLDKSSLDRLRTNIGFVLQEAGEYFIERNILQEIFFKEQKYTLSALSPDDLTYLERFALPAHLAESSGESLSGGERQKAALAAALRTVPEILLLDEPLLGLDVPSKENLRNLIVNLQGITKLYVTHDLREVLGAADRIWLLELGQVILDCSAQDWREHEALLRRSGVRC